MNNIEENYDYYKIPLKCALYVLEEKTKENCNKNIKLTKKKNYKK